MTMIDDDVLAGLFTRAADALAAPQSGPADILERAFATTSAPGDDESPDDPAEGDVALDDLVEPRARRLARVVRTHRMLSAAAVVLLVFVIVGGTTWLGTSPPPTQLSAGSLHSASGAHSGNRSVAVPGFSVGRHGRDHGGDRAEVSRRRPVAAPRAGSAAATGALSAPTTSGTGGATTNTAPALPSGVGQSARVEQTGSLSLTVAKGALTKTMTELSFLASAYNGFVANSQTQRGAVATTGAPSGSITLQVPVDSFSDLLKKAQALGKTDDLTTKATDVTGQYVDLQSRITALQDSRQQYLTIMAKATSVGDVLAVQAQLDTIQSQIEQLQGQLQLLTSQTTYSTLNIEVSEGTPRVPPHPTPHRSGLSSAWHDSVHGFVDGVEGIIRLAGPVLFTLLCALALILGGRVLWRRYQRHNL